MNFYSVYGLTVAAALPLPELRPALPVDAPDLVIAPERLGWTPPEPRSDWFNCAPCPDGSAYLSWQGVARFRVDGDGARIACDAAPGVEASVLRLPLLGAVLAYALRRRGCLVLHASAVRMAESGCASLFVGRSGSGKSTLAAALERRGHKIVVDDVVALRVDPGGSAPALVLDGYCRCKLWPDAARALGRQPSALPRVHPAHEKVTYTPRPSDGDGAPAASAPTPLGAVYDLRVGAEPGIEPLRGAEAAMLLVANSFVAMLDARLAASGAAEEMAQCARVAREGRVARLTRPADLARLGETARLIESRSARVAHDALAVAP